MSRLINLIAAAMLGVGGSSVAVMLILFVMSSITAASGSLHPLVLFFGIVFIFGSIIKIISGIINSYCPNCRRSFRLRHSSKVLVEPTPDSEGKRHVIRLCSCCSYRQEYEEVIPCISYIEAP
jgi:hypothetical protein